MDYDIINVVREEQRVMGFPGEIRKKNYVGKNSFLRR